MSGERERTFGAYKSHTKLILGVLCCTDMLFCLWERLACDLVASGALEKCFPTDSAKKPSVLVSSLDAKLNADVQEMAALQSSVEELNMNQALSEAELSKAVAKAADENCGSVLRMWFAPMRRLPRGGLRLCQA